MAKKTTIEELARITAKGFDGVNTRLDGVDTRLDDIDTRLDKMDTRLDRIENLLLRDHLNRIERLEDSVLQLKVKSGIR